MRNSNLFLVNKNLMKTLLLLFYVVYIIILFHDKNRSIEVIYKLNVFHNFHIQQ